MPTETQEAMTAADRLHHALKWNEQLQHQAQEDSAPAYVLPLLQHWQRQRLHLTYADLLEHKRYQPACEFFLDELYGGKDFSQRHHDLARVEPIMSRIMPEHLLHTVAEALEVQALSIELDLLTSASIAELHPELVPVVENTQAVQETAAQETDSILESTAKEASEPHINQGIYAKAYRHAGRAEDRQRQIDSIMQVGRALDSVVHKFWVFQLLKLLRGPAVAAGFGELQHFLETGFDAFKQLKGADRFLKTIHERESAAMAAIFSASDRPFPNLELA